MASVILINKDEQTYECPVGFSWTCLLFGGFVALFRGDIGGFFKAGILSICTVGIYWIVLPFTYNGNFIRRKLASGWKPATQNDINTLVSHGLAVLNYSTPDQNQ